jgi:hypothetical protein
LQQELFAAAPVDAASAALRLRPWTVKRAVPFVRQVHRRLPEVNGGLWAVSVRLGNEVVGCAIVGFAARLLAVDDACLCVLRVAVLPGHMNACSMLYGSCSRAARGMGASPTSHWWKRRRR